jgi:hypothetical protein
MQEQHRQALGVAAALEVQAVAVADLEQAVFEGRRGREEEGVGRSGVGRCHGRDAVWAGAKGVPVMSQALSPRGVRLA